MHRGRHRRIPPEAELRDMEDIFYYGIAFVFLGLCLLYVRAADRL